MVAHTIVHFEIPARDPKTLAKFYHRVFGWRFRKGPVPALEYWIIATGPRGRSVSGGMYRKVRREDRPRNFILVDRIETAIRAFKAAGGTEVVGVREVPGMGRSFIGNDPEGNPIALWEPQMEAPIRPRSKSDRRR